LKIVRPDRSEDLQRSDGDPAELLSAVTDHVPHLRWRIATPNAGLLPGELACDRLAADPDALAHAVALSADGRGSDDPQVLASLWWQGYAYRVAGTALASWLLTGRAPDVRAASLAVGIARSRPSSVTFLAGGDPPTADAGTLCDWLFAGHLDAVAGSLRRRHALGTQLVWGNVAAACASGAGAVRDAAGPDWHERVDRFLAAAPHDLRSLGGWSQAPEGWSYQRRTCCLWWKTSAAGGGLCADCSLRRDAGALSGQ
jgi:ferric iron reductase protein FhuF